MKITTLFKQFAIIALVVGVAVGCASKPPESTGPTPQELADEAIAAAQAAIDEANALGVDVAEAERLLADARAAYDSGDYPTATDLANQAERSARDAIERYKAEQAAAAAAAAAAAQKAQSTSSYTVSRGDSLWGIAGRSSVYGNPYQWPLIYKANKGQIKDADLIYPGQVFEYQSSPSASEVSAAVQHAKTRGAWSVGAVEASDEAYLAR